MGQILDFVRDPQNDFIGHTVAYLRLCALPIGLAIVIGLVFGVAVARRPTAAFLIGSASGLARAIPTLAFLAAVLPYLGIGFWPAVIALTALGVPPVLLNTIAGLRGIDPAVIDSARGMGMTPRQVLTRVEIPLMLPVVAAGIRTAAVQIVATAPLAALIGAGGYGDYILAGVNLLQRVPLLVGAGSVAILALGVEIALASVQRAVTPIGLRIRANDERPATPASA
ncbi:MAG TPA: ABC transporter permease [Thermomicrobiales bacterium]|nr:glycine/betaine ABC transporter [Chloroflexota bacterium]HBY46154.1 glycine/betaine ABC transporter [Chloroflexota bacterium]HCG28194.1 glycine/betaine ABC transporter [Chloroflexota bacterium]HQZ89975.1 ABC transporter permease [Thermomicrobiales bacterium]HRA30827.1 ABC transporter permease [Thermomicrobiales bacterium]